MRFEFGTSRQSCGWKFNTQTIGWWEICQQSSWATQAIHAGVGVQNTELSTASRATVSTHTIRRYAVAATAVSGAQAAPAPAGT